MATSLTKSEIARRQLGTALYLFLEEKDPVSIHSLACAGCEIAESLSKRAGETTFLMAAIDSGLQSSPSEFRALRNRFWNAFKHPTATRQGSDDEEELLASFSDRENEDRLFIGWVDYSNAVGNMPIEAAVFNAWVMTLRNPGHETEEGKTMQRNLDLEFPGLRGLSPKRQKHCLRKAIEKWGQDESLLRDPMTDPRPLLLG